MISLSEILKKVNEKEIMEHYYGCSITDKKSIYRNITRNDKDGSCYFNWYNGRYYLVDRARGKDSNFNCYNLVQYIYGCNFEEALRHINKDMNLGIEDTNQVFSKPGRKVEIKEKETNKVYQRKINYEITARKWNDNDINYWNTFYITLNTLIKFNVLPVKEFKSDSLVSFELKTKYKYKVDDPCYAYVFKGKKSIRVKLYRPLSSEYKWQGNINNSDIYGLDLLPDFTNTIYICSGLKDLMCITEMNLVGIAPQSESTDIPDEIIENIKTKCKNLVILFDNDNAGLSNAKKYSMKYGCRYIELPKDNENKDVADFTKQYGIEAAKNIIKKCKLKL